MITRTHLLERIDAYLLATGKSPKRLCLDAGVDHHVMSRLKRGESVTLRSIEKIEDVLSVCQLNGGEDASVTTNAHA